MSITFFLILFIFISVSKGHPGGSESRKFENRCFSLYFWGQNNINTGCLIIICFLQFIDKIFSYLLTWYHNLWLSSFKHNYLSTWLRILCILSLTFEKKIRCRLFRIKTFLGRLRLTIFKVKVLCKFCVLTIHIICCKNDLYKHQNPVKGTKVHMWVQCKVMCHNISGYGFKGVILNYFFYRYFTLCTCYVYIFFLLLVFCVIRFKIL